MAKSQGLLLGLPHLALPLHAGAQGFGSASTAFPGHKERAGSEWSSWDKNQDPYWLLAPQAEA